VLQLPSGERDAQGYQPGGVPAKSSSTGSREDRRLSRTAGTSGITAARPAAVANPRTRVRNHPSALPSLTRPARRTCCVVCFSAVTASS